MRISSFNVTDVGYHYIGLRVINSLPANVKREEQMTAIARGVLKYVSDKSLRLLLPEPKGSFDTVGEKVCNELSHFGLIVPVRASAYTLTEMGTEVLALLNERRFIELRRLMVRVHLETYDNLRYIVQRHLEEPAIWRPIVEANRLQEVGYFARLLQPNLGEVASEFVEGIEEDLVSKTPSKAEDQINDLLLRYLLPEYSTGVSLFRALVERLASLRLLNVTRDIKAGCNFIKTYGTAIDPSRSPLQSWHHELTIKTRDGGQFHIAVCEPDLKNANIQHALIEAITGAFEELPNQAGFYDLPDVRTYVCERLRFPEAAFDEGLNNLLDSSPPPVTVGLRYEGITGYRKPLIRTRAATQIYNLIRQN